MKRIKAPITVVLFVAFLYVLAAMSLNNEIIFPEVAALSIGAWYIKNSPWEGNLLNLWLSPSLAALTGVGVLHFIHTSQVVLIACTFVLVLLQLYLLRSNILPSISAAILPILLNADSLYYPMSVCMFSGIIAGGRWYFNRFQSHDNSATLITHEEKQKRWGLIEIKFWLKIFCGIIFVATIALQVKWIYIISPPLIVVFIEFASSSGRKTHRPGRLFWLILAAAISGTVGVEVIHILLNWPLWIAAACIVLWIFFLFHQFEFVFPPAAAISLLPTIIHEKMLLLYPLQVAIGAILFIAIGKVIISSTQSSKNYTGAWDSKMN
jgi:hypothetical protein